MSASKVCSKDALQAHGIWVCFGFWVSVFVPQVLEAVGRKDLRMPRRFGTGAQVQISPWVAQPVASVQAPFDLYGSSTKPRTYFFPQYSPAIPVPAYGWS